MKPHPRNRKPVRKDRTTPPPRADLLFALADRAAAENGAEILERRLNASGVLRLVIDREAGPVDSEVLIRIMRALRRAMTDREVDPGLYQIEVDSPGRNRLLATARHFERFAGQRVRIQLARPGSGRPTMLARLLGARDGQPLIEAAEGGPRVLERDEYSEIRLAP